MVLRDKACYELIFKINLPCVQSSDDITLLGIIIDKNLTFILIHVLIPRRFYIIPC